MQNFLTDFKLDSLSVDRETGRNLVTFCFNGKSWTEDEFLFLDILGSAFTGVVAVIFRTWSLKIWFLRLADFVFSLVGCATV